MKWWSAQSAKLQEFLAEYGATGLVVWFAIFFATWGGFWFAINAGFAVESTSGSVGTFWAAYGATQLTKPIRIAATFLLTPIVVQVRNRIMGASGEEP